MKARPIFLLLGAAGLLAAGLAVWVGWPRWTKAPEPELRPGAVTSESCRECHAAEYEAWRGSHHALAERSIDLEQDRPAFEPAHRFKAGSVTNEARLAQGRFEIVTRGPGLKLAAFAVDRVIGVDPVRQYLTAMPGGRWQAQEDSYGPSSNVWFDVFGGEDRQPGEWGHWTGRGMNWNSTCAVCHNTRLRKNYSEATDTYHTTMDEMGIGCAGCHAGMDAHLAWQRVHPGTKEKEPGAQKATASQILDNCGSCHARRQELTGEFAPGHGFFDDFQLQIPDETDTWLADGQIHGEDYEFSSFLGSKMSQRGVICLDCHNPHTAKTILPGNALCLRCHNGSNTNAPVIEPLAHSHHSAGNAGNDCISCHMPVTTYMQLHGRHDHGFTIPDPLLTKELNIPNACNRCHKDKPTEWSLAAVEKWYGQKMERPTRQRARWVAAAQRGDAQAENGLLRMLAPGREGFYWRAVAAGLLWRWPENGDVKSALLAAAKDPHPLVRERAVHSLEPAIDAGDETIIDALRPALADPFRSVRVAAAWTLRSVLDPQSEAGVDLKTMLDFNADQPTGQYRRAQYALARHDLPGALADLQRAIAWDPFSPPFRLAAAEVLQQMGRTNEAIGTLQELCRRDPQSEEGEFKLGLALADNGRIAEAATAFREAAKLGPNDALAWYNLGLAASALGQVEDSLAALDRAAALVPADAQIPYERARTLAKAGRYTEARGACRKALQLQADFGPAKELLEALPPPE